MSSQSHLGILGLVGRGHRGTITRHNQRCCVSTRLATPLRTGTASKWVVDQNKELSLLSNTTHKTKDIACLKSQNRCSDRSHLPLAPIHSSQPATAGRQPLTQKFSLRRRPPPKDSCHSTQTQKTTTQNEMDPKGGRESHRILRVGPTWTSPYRESCCVSTRLATPLRDCVQVGS